MIRPAQVNDLEAALLSRATDLAAQHLRDVQAAHPYGAKAVAQPTERGCFQHEARGDLDGLRLNLVHTVLAQVTEHFMAVPRR
ncbi:MAG: hypothetical protein WBP72_09680 [Rhodocyclaceae bacterium]|jgi:hypothetical protein